MKIKLWRNRKIVLTVVTAILRALSASAVGYLTAKDLPSDIVEQVASAIPAVGVLALTVGWELFDRRKAVKTAELRATETAIVLERMHLGTAPSELLRAAAERAREVNRV